MGRVGRVQDGLGTGLLLLVAVLVAGLASSQHAAGQVEPTSAAPAEVDSLIEKLGDQEFTVRERSTSRLVEIGLPAVEALRAAAEHPDREIRYRSRRILSIVQDLDFETRLQAFLSDPDSDRDHGLPGWKQYRSFAGDDATAREMFVEMQRAEPELLAAIAAGPQATTEMLAKRTQQIQQTMQANRNQLIVSLGSITALLFATMADEVTLTPLNGQQLANFLYQPAFNNALHSGGNRPVLLRRMLGQWIRRRTTDVDGYQAIMLALRYDIKEGVVPAERLLKQAASQMNQAGNAHLRQYGLLAMARFGGREHLPVVEPLLNDKTDYGGQIRVNNVNYRTQIRDIALATVVEMAGQNHADYGFDRLQKANPYVFNVSTLAFENDAKRDEAIERWRQFRAQAPAAAGGAVGEQDSDENQPDDTRQGPPGR
ncbi:MAG: hypothetical protein J5I93_13620 [Pirellulaceae bacterium]|nr:hypothetical protein [Pirellulaceae bacterium]